jgi:TctA family transporter
MNTVLNGLGTVIGVLLAVGLLVILLIIVACLICSFIDIVQIMLLKLKINRIAKKINKDVDKFNNKQIENKED